MRINVSNKRLPGVSVERTLILGDELIRDDVFLNDEYIGQVVYRQRKNRRTGFTDYGWQRAKAPKQSKLLTKVEAIHELIETATLLRGR